MDFLTEDSVANIHKIEDLDKQIASVKEEKQTLEATVKTHADTILQKDTALKDAEIAWKNIEVDLKQQLSAQKEAVEAEQALWKKLNGE